MLYRKNVLKWEQALRALAGGAVASLPLMMNTEFPALWIGSGLFFAATGLFGFCPACYMVGRRLPSVSRTE